MLGIPNATLDELAVRFLLNATEYDFEHPERFYFILEEAHWFYIDFFQRQEGHPKLNFQTFKGLFLKHVRINDFVDDCFGARRSEYCAKIDCVKDYTCFFNRYKHSVPVYGGFIFNPSMDSLLLVKGYMKTSQYVFPRGKRDFGESGVECAIREIYEEIGLNISKKIINYTLRTSDTNTMFLILNVDENISLKTRTRNEIRSIKWIPIKDILESGKPDLDRVRCVYRVFAAKIDDIRRLRVRLDVGKIEVAFDNGFVESLKD